MFKIIEKALESKIFWISVLVLTFYLYFKTFVYSYWRKHGIPHDVPTVPFGTLGTDLLAKKTTFGEKIRQTYEKFKNHPFHGLYMFHIPTLMLNDPELIKYVLVKEFANFPNRGIYCNEKIDPLSGHLFRMSGDKWRSLRIKLSPTFTSGKLKHMYPFVQEIADEMVDVANETLLKTDVLDLKDLVARYTMDTIFSLAFGFKSHTLKNPDSEFLHYGYLSTRYNPIKVVLAHFSPYILEKLNIPFSNTELIKFFVKLFQDMVEKRKIDKTNRKDFLNLLIELIDHGQIKDTESKDEEVGNLTKLEATAQAYVFFVAGYDTSSSIIAHALYELALNPDEQEKVQQEIDKLFERHESFDYKNVLHLEYLEMVLYETMRKHSSVPFLNRICVKDCKLPYSDFVVPKGMSVLIPISGLHLDPNIYPNPEKFDPMRFSKDNIATRHPYAYLAFGEGPRTCIGKRLAVMMSMIALATLLMKFKFSTCEKTPIPNRYATDTVIQAPRDPIYLRVEKRSVKY